MADEHLLSCYAAQRVTPTTSNNFITESMSKNFNESTKGVRIHPYRSTHYQQNPIQQSPNNIFPYHGVSTFIKHDDQAFHTRQIVADNIAQYNMPGKQSQQQTPQQQFKQPKSQQQRHRNGFTSKPIFRKQGQKQQQQQQPKSKTNFTHYLPEKNHHNDVVKQDNNKKNSNAYKKNNSSNLKELINSRVQQLQSEFKGSVIKKVAPRKLVAKLLYQNYEFNTCFEKMYFILQNRWQNEVIDLMINTYGSDNPDKAYKITAKNLLTVLDQYVRQDHYLLASLSARDMNRIESMKTKASEIIQVCKSLKEFAKKMAEFSCEQMDTQKDTYQNSIDNSNNRFQRCVIDPYFKVDVIFPQSNISLEKMEIKEKIDDDVEKNQEDCTQQEKCTSPRWADMVCEEQCLIVNDHDGDSTANERTMLTFGSFAYWLIFRYHLLYLWENLEDIPEIWMKEHNNQEYGIVFEWAKIYPISQIWDTKSISSYERYKLKQQVALDIQKQQHDENSVVEDIPDTVDA